MIRDCVGSTMIIMSGKEAEKEVLASETRGSDHNGSIYRPASLVHVLCNIVVVCRKYALISIDI